ncbi:MAG TPA: CapA family protein [Methylomirabilota bacterium]|nr:CapA family protein [Methylomirabilota bacterium]
MASEPVAGSSARITLFLCGDAMTGRGVDQILSHPSDPRLHEPVLKNARGYVELAEARGGPIERPVDAAYIWGDALAEFARVSPDVKIINLETAVTTSSEYWPGKGIHYRMHPSNVPCLTMAGIDVCVLANNHVLDWGYAGLRETLETLQRAGIKTAGAGRDAVEAAAPALVEVADKGRVAVVALGSETSGIPPAWAASATTPGINLLPDLSPRTARALARAMQAVRRPRTIVVVSLHWGENWGYRIPRSQQAFARMLIDEAGVDVVHGHSSHHPKAIELYRDRPIFYGCGDFLTDYEGIGGHEAFRGELGLMYFPTLDVLTGRLVHLAMTPTRVARFRVTRALPEEAQWLGDVLTREGQRFGTRASLTEDHGLTLRGP